MRLEVRFFSAVPGVPARLSVGILVVDFDETLTEADTTPSIIAAAIDAAEGSASGANSTCCQICFLEPCAQPNQKHWNRGRRAEGRGEAAAGGPARPAGGQLCA